MNRAPQTSTTETALQKERRLFSELWNRLLNTALNWVFDLRPERAQRRMRNLFLLFLLTGVLITLIYYPLNVWIAYIQDVFLYLLNPTYQASYIGTDPITKFVTLLIRALLDAHILQYLPIFIAPFFIAQHLAALYLADIFELADISVARRFVSEVALSGSDETIRISRGQISDQHLESPNYLIGGPGKVIVDLDSVALFERADGTPHVIGPTGKEPHGKATIDGFERFRLALDIRDQHVELRDQDNKSQSVKGRSIDGIPITATDVRLMFSVYRGDTPQPSAEFPYPFSKDAIERITYKSTSKVTPDQKDPSTYDFNWINNMIGLIRGRLGGFMSMHKLTEYLASTGAPEFEKAVQREELIAEQVRRLTQPSEEADIKAPKPPPSFTPRYKITNLFSQFAEEFTKSARNNGVELHWIGVGTWKTPPEIDIVSEKHLEAWKVSQENLKAGSKESMDKAESEAMLEKLAALIGQVPINAFRELDEGYRTPFRKIPGRKQTPRKPDTRRYRGSSGDDDIRFSEEELAEVLTGPMTPDQLLKRINDKIEAGVESALKGHEKGESEQRADMRSLLMEYRKQLSEAVQFMNAKGEPIPSSIREAINYIHQQMGFKHFVGRP
jgi:hypothetical protein